MLAPSVISIFYFILFFLSVKTSRPLEKGKLFKAATGPIPGPPNSINESEDFNLRAPNKGGDKPRRYFSNKAGAVGVGFIPTRQGLSGLPICIF
jgi:hypothetical protein